MELGFSVIAKGYWDHMPQQSTKEIFNLVLFAPKVATIAPSSRVQIEDLKLITVSFWKSVFKTE